MPKRKRIIRNFNTKEHLADMYCVDVRVFNQWLDALDEVTRSQLNRNKRYTYTPKQIEIIKREFGEFPEK